MADIHDFHTRLVDAGAAKNLRPGVWATCMQNPEGYTVELIQYDQ